MCLTHNTTSSSAGAVLLNHATCGLKSKKQQQHTGVQKLRSFSDKVTRFPILLHVS